jgi:hypothetical protein
MRSLSGTGATCPARLQKSELAKVGLESGPFTLHLFPSPAALGYPKALASIEAQLAKFDDAPKKLSQGQQRRRACPAKMRHLRDEPDLAEIAKRVAHHGQ